MREPSFQKEAGSPGRGGFLYPQQNGVRNLLDLSGIWGFQLDPEEKGEAKRSSPTSDTST